MLSGVARIGILRATDLETGPRCNGGQKEACKDFAIHIFSETVSFFVISQLLVAEKRSLALYTLRNFTHMGRERNSQ